MKKLISRKPDTPLNAMQESKRYERGSVADVWARLIEPDQIAPYRRIAESLGLKLETQSFGPEHDDWRKPYYLPRRTDVAYARELIAQFVSINNILLMNHVRTSDIKPIYTVYHVKPKPEAKLELYDESLDQVDIDHRGSTPHVKKFQLKKNWF